MNKKDRALIRALQRLYTIEQALRTGQGIEISQVKETRQTIESVLHSEEEQTYE